jgi:choline dehydrogenase-like flavoprotein
MGRDDGNGRVDPLRTEVAVIGSGPGGAVTACLLAEGGRDVLLVEDGPFLASDSCPPFSKAEMVTKYRNGGLTVSLGQSRVAYVEGRCVGGGSEINSGLYHRTPPEVLEDWRRTYRVEALTEADLRPHFEACEREVGVSTAPNPLPAASQKLHQGASRLGWKSVEIPRMAGAPTPGRHSMTRTFIPRLLAAGGRVQPDTCVRRLRRRNGCWHLQAEVRVAGAAVRRVALVADAVFVAGGAIQTPALLQRSGLRGPVRAGLRCHPTVKVVARFPDEVPPPAAGVPAHQVREFSPRWSFGCSISSPPHLAVALTDHPGPLGDLGRQAPHLAVYYAMTRGGRGGVRTVPFCREPLVFYRLEPPDRAELAQALRELCRCLLAAGAEALYPTLGGQPPLCSADDLATLPAVLEPGRASLMTIHLFSSCPLGEDRQRCAVDSFGRVHGQDNLYVADASLLCGPPGVNPQGSVMALARRNALHFLGKL